MALQPLITLHYYFTLYYFQMHCKINFNLQHFQYAKQNLAICNSIPYMALQPLPYLGLPHKTPPFIPIFSSSLPSPYPQQL